ncbi:hypothetical protein C8R48DRAFT_734495 [Suillus tomentosus]|nr:hypothetical protein C8R48DRAFT_734495 [Suillus tomentosus]
MRKLKISRKLSVSGICNESLTALPALHADYFNYGWLSHTAYMSRYQILHDTADLSLAAENSILASCKACHDTSMHHIIGPSQQSSMLMDLQWRPIFFELLDAYLAMRSSITSRREAATTLSYARSLPADAASCAIHPEYLLNSSSRTVASDSCSYLTDEPTNPKLARKSLELIKCLSDAHGSTASPPTCLMSHLKEGNSQEKRKGLLCIQFPTDGFVENSTKVCCRQNPP